MTSPTARRPAQSVPASRRAHRRRHLSALLLVLDAGGVVVACAAARLPASSWAPVCVVTLAVLAARRGFRVRLAHSAWDDLRPLAVAAGAGLVVGAVLRGVGPDRVGALPGLLADWVVLVAALVAGRCLWHLGVRLAARRGWTTRRAVLIGSGEDARALADALVADPAYGVRPVGFLDHDDPGGDWPVPWLGPVSELSSWVRRADADIVLLARSAQGQWDEGPEHLALVAAVRACDWLDLDMYCVPRLFETRALGHRADRIGGTPVVPLGRAARRSPWWPVKRVLDVVVAAVLLLVTSPVLAVAVLALRRELGPGVLFRQERIGLDGRTFTLLKLRTLPHSDSHQPWSVAHDPRLGRAARLLRRTSVDELPQLVNVLRGEMSMVGPRPERVSYVEQFAEVVPHYADRHRLPVGLTGWAQVHGLRGDTSIAERVRFDNFYIQNWTPWLDLQILARTIAAVLRREGS